MKNILFLLTGSLLSFNVNAWSLFGSYDDCILDKVKAGMSNAGIKTVTKACRNKFPLPPPPSQPKLLKKKYTFDDYVKDGSCKDIVFLTKEQMLKIGFKWQEDSGYFKIYNENDFSVINVFVKYKYKNSGKFYVEMITNKGYWFNEKQNHTAVFPKLTYLPVHGLVNQKEIESAVIVKAINAECLKNPEE